MEEIWDAYDKDGQRLPDLRLVRGQLLPEGCYHLVIQVLVRHLDGDILFMQRASDAPLYPGYFEGSAGGSVLAGENSFAAGLRELEEETGLHPVSMCLVQRSRWDAAATLVHYYVAETTLDKTAVRYQKSETQNHIWVKPAELDSFLAGHDLLPYQVDFLKAFADNLRRRT